MWPLVNTLYNWQKWFGSGNKDGFYSQIGEGKLCCKTQVGWATQSYAAMQPACVVNICSLQLVLPVNNSCLQMNKWAAQSFLNLVNSFFRFFISTMIYQLSLTYSRYQTKAGVKKVCDTCSHKGSVNFHYRRCHQGEILIYHQSEIPRLTQKSKSLYTDNLRHATSFTFQFIFVLKAIRNTQWFCSLL